MTLSTGTTRGGAGGNISCIVGDGDSGRGADIFVKAGDTEDFDDDIPRVGGNAFATAGAGGYGGHVLVEAGQGATSSGGSIALESGFGVATSSGNVTVATLESGPRGVSGCLQLRTGTLPLVVLVVSE